MKKLHLKLKCKNYITITTILVMSVIADLILIFKILIKNFFNLKKIYRLSFCIVTASDADHFIYLKNFIKNFKKLNQKTFNKLIIYDLGLNGTQVEELEKFTFLELRKFPFSNYPTFFSTRLKEHRNKIGGFAWKPAIINILKSEGIERIMWFDSATELRGSLILFKLFIFEYGFSSFKSSGNIQEWSYPSVIKNLEIENSNNILNASNLMAGVIGYDFNSYFANLLFDNWNKLCKDEELIFPKGSSSENHRHDQTLLSICYWKVSQNNIPNLNKIFGIKIQHWPNKILFFFDERYELRNLLIEKFLFQSTNSDKRCKIIILFNSHSLSKIPWRLIFTKKVLLFTFKSSDENTLKKYFLKNRFITIKTMNNLDSVNNPSKSLDNSLYLKIERIIDEEYKITFNDE